MIRQPRSALLSLNRAANQELAASAVESAADGPSVESERHRSSTHPGLEVEKFSVGDEKPTVEFKYA